MVAKKRPVFLFNDPSFNKLYIPALCSTHPPHHQVDKLGNVRDLRFYYCSRENKIEYNYCMRWSLNSTGFLSSTLSWWLKAAAECQIRNFGKKNRERRLNFLTITVLYRVSQKKRARKLPANMNV